ncbi:MAG: hypothetical protein M3483_08515, partial [Gemmatimonadota bacterium]|nr:hypothetical protein [Gemmatimonadota bacterium]
MSLLLFLPLQELAAQESPSAEDPCPQGWISEIVIENGAVFDASDPDLDPRFAWAYRTANRLHIPTKQSVIRRELLFRTGDCFSPELLLDSERTLRASPFLADADLFGVRQPDGSHRVIVETRDEWSTRIEPQVDSRGGGLVGVEVREENLLGTGQRVTAFWGERYREAVFGASFWTPHLAGTLLDAEVIVERSPNGYLYGEGISYPFRGEEGRWAFRQRFEHSDRYFEYLATEDEGRVR